MADPIINIVLKEEGATGAAGGTGTGGGVPARTPRDPTGGGEGEEGFDYGEWLKTVVGRRLPGGKKTLEALGLDKVIAEVGTFAGDYVEKLKEFFGMATKKVDEAEQEVQNADTTPPSGKQPPGDKKPPGKKPPGGGEEGAEEAEGAEGAEAGGVSDLAAAAGGLAVVLYAVGKAGDMAYKAIRTIGEAGVALVHGDVGAIFSKLAHGIIDTVDEIPLLGKAITAPIKPFLAVAEAASALKDAFLQRAHELAMYSGAISVAEARAEVRKVRADFQETQALQGGLAKLVDLQSQMETAFQRALTPAKEEILEAIIPIVEVMAAGAEWLAENKELVKFIAQAGIEVTKITTALLLPKGFFIWVLTKLGAFDVLIEWARQKIEGDEKTPDGQWNELLQAIYGIGTDVDASYGPPPYNAPPGAPLPMV